MQISHLERESLVHGNSTSGHRKLRVTRNSTSHSSVGYRERNVASRQCLQCRRDSRKWYVLDFAPRNGILRDHNRKGWGDGSGVKRLPRMREDEEFRALVPT